MEKGAQQSTYLLCEWLQESVQAIVLEEVLVMQPVVPIISFSWNESLSMASHPAFTPIWAEGWPKGGCHYIDQLRQGVSVSLPEHRWDAKCNAVLLPWNDLPVFSFLTVKMYMDDQPVIACRWSNHDCVFPGSNESGHACTSTKHMIILQ